METRNLQTETFPYALTEGARWRLATVSTAVGGRVTDAANSGQFDISDPRSVSEMVRDLAAIGYQAVAKDWEACDC